MGRGIDDEREKAMVQYEARTCRVIWLFLGGIRKIEPNIKYRIVSYNIIRTAARLPRLSPLFVRFLRKGLGPIESTVVAFIVNPREIMQPGHS